MRKQKKNQAEKNEQGSSTKLNTINEVTDSTLDTPGKISDPKQNMNLAIQESKPQQKSPAKESEQDSQSVKETQTPMSGSSALSDILRNMYKDAPPFHN